MVGLQHHTNWIEESSRVLLSYGISPKTLTEINEGLINVTIDVQDGTGKRFILQKVSKIFDISVNLKIAEVTSHLRKKGVICPRMVRTINDDDFLELDDACWRLFEYIPGHSKIVFKSKADVGSAGRALGEFHRALNDFDLRLLTSDRPHIHYLEPHMSRLEKTLLANSSHRLYSQCCELEKHIQLLSSKIPSFDFGPSVVAHGDPKVSNIIFSNELDTALCFVDLDTVGLMPLALELGDAMRSWCNPFPEDSLSSFFSMEMYKAAIEGYMAVRDDIDHNIYESVLPATLQIYLELAARFLMDVINESYFGWDNEMYESASSHNFSRANAQILAAESLATHILKN